MPCQHQVVIQFRLGTCRSHFSFDPPAAKSSMSRFIKGTCACDATGSSCTKDFLFVYKKRWFYCVLSLFQLSNDAFCTASKRGLFMCLQPDRICLDRSPPPPPPGWGDLKGENPLGGMLHPDECLNPIFNFHCHSFLWPFCLIREFTAPVLCTLWQSWITPDVVRYQASFIVAK